MTSRWAYDGALLRRMASWGSRRGPRWFVAYAPAVVGVAAAAALPGARHAVRKNLRRVAGPRPWLRETWDVARTFASYAGSLSDALAAGGERDPRPHVIVEGSRAFEAARKIGKGLLLVTAHTGGWEVVGPVMAREFGLRLAVVMERERDREAMAVNDQARRDLGVEIFHVGDDPLSSLPLLRHLRGGGAVGIQLDRIPQGGQVAPVRFLGAPGALPAGPLRLAQLAGAPLVPVFCAREGFRAYRVQIHPPLFVARQAGPQVLAETAQILADHLGQFLEAHPTQWFHFPGR